MPNLTWDKHLSMMSEVEDEQVIPAPEAESPKSAEKGVNKTLLGILVILALLVVGGAAFIFGSKQRTATPTSSPTPSPTPTQEASVSATVGTEKTPSPTATSTPTPTPTPVSQTIVISASSDLDGFRASNGGGNKNDEIRVGRNLNLVIRGFVSFALSSIPSGASIEKATLRLYQKKIDGDPYGVGGFLKVDHINYSTLEDNSAYGASALSSSFGTLTENAVVEWKDIEVTDMLKDDLSNGRGQSQYRLHFAIESQGGTLAGDFAYFESAENYFGTGNTPQLVVKYH